MMRPALVSLVAPLDRIRAELLSLGATAQHRRSVAFDLGDHLLILDHDRDDMTTTIAVGGPDPLGMAQWLATELGDHWQVQGVLPPLPVPSEIPPEVTADVTAEIA
jgi:hypothetical protein